MDDDYKIFLSPSSSPPIIMPPYESFAVAYDPSSYYSPPAPAPQILTTTAGSGHGYGFGTPLYPTPWSPPGSTSRVPPDYYGFIDGQLPQAAPGLFYKLTSKAGGEAGIEWLATAAPGLPMEPWQLTPEESLKVDMLLYAPQSRPRLPVFEAICPSKTHE